MIVSGILIINPTLGLKSLKTAYLTIKEIEVMRALRKDLSKQFYYEYSLREVREVNRVLVCNSFEPKVST